MQRFIVARSTDGGFVEYLHSVSADGRRHMVCTAMVAALRFDTLDEAANAAGECMDRRPGEEYGAVGVVE